MPHTAVNAIDPKEFQRVLSRNVKLPLIGGLIGAVVFVGLIFYLLSVISWVEHTDRVTREASELQRLSVDLETGMRGFLITGDEAFLQPYESAQPRLMAGLASLRTMVTDNQTQVDRIDRIATLQTSWNQFAVEMIALRRAGGDYTQAITAGRGKRLSDDMRTGYGNFIGVEQTLRFQRNNEANNTALAVIGLFLFFTLSLTGLLAFFGRRQLVALSTGYDTVLQRQATHGEALQRQAWLRGAQTDLTGELVGELSAQEMGRKVLDFFACRTCWTDPRSS
jgi:CHASE3 domain sensor protein